MINTQAQRKLPHTWMILVIVNQHLVQIGGMDDEPTINRHSHKLNCLSGSGQAAKQGLPKAPYTRGTCPKQGLLRSVTTALPPPTKRAAPPYPSQDLDKRQSKAQAEGALLHLVAASIHDEYSIGPSIRLTCTRYCFTMTKLIQVCSKFH